MKWAEIRILTTVTLVMLLQPGCKQQTSNDTNEHKLESIFAKGELGPADKFTGKAWHTALLQHDSVYNTVVGNVYFEPGARSNWHTHPSGQILMITDGIGYHQVKGQPKQTMKKGDIVKCPANVLHWHGASAETGVQQLYILPNTEKGIVTWMQKVTDEEYLKP